MKAYHRHTSMLPGMQRRDYVVIDDVEFKESSNRYLLPQEAREFAKQLLQAADKAEQKQPQVEHYKMFDG